MKHEYTPEDLLYKYREIRSRISLREFFNKPLHTKTQEIWCAAHFALGYKKCVKNCKVIIYENDEQLVHDFELKIGDQLFPFQITECQKPGRRRGDEYKKSETFVKSDNLSAGSEYGPKWIRTAIEKKYKKYYSGCQDINLLVYINFAARDQQYNITKKECSEVSKHFNSVWLLVGNALCCIKSSTTLGGFNDWKSIDQSLASKEM